MAPRDAKAVVPLELLYRMDSIASLLVHRKRNALSDEDARDLDAISRQVRQITNEVERAARNAPAATPEEGTT